MHAPALDASWSDREVLYAIAASPVTHDLTVADGWSELCVRHPEEQRYLVARTFAELEDLDGTVLIGRLDELHRAAPATLRAVVADLILHAALVCHDRLDGADQDRMVELVAQQPARPADHAGRLRSFSAALLIEAYARAS